MVEGIKARDKTLHEIFQNNQEIEIPLYQRRYKWKEEKISVLWDDILAEVEEQEDERNLFLGPIVFHKETTQENNRKYLVDGQQRLTTLSLLIADLFHELGDKNFDGDQNQKAGGLRRDLGYYLFDYNGRISFDEIESYDPRLKLSKRDREQYKKYLAEGEKIGQNTYFKKGIKTCESLVEAYIEEQVRQELNKSSEEEISEDELEEYGPKYWLELAAELLSICRNTMSFARIEISEPFDPLSVFESLNSKGMPLAASDLIKNVLIHNVDDGNEEEISERWDDLAESLEGDLVSFIRYWYISEHNFIRKKNLYNKIKRLIRTPDSSVDELMEGWESASEWYLAFKGEAKPPEGDDELENLVEKFSKVKFRQGYPILLAFSSKDDYSEIKNAIPTLITAYIRLFVTASIRGSLFEDKLDSICEKIRSTDQGNEYLDKQVASLIKGYCPEGEMNWKNVTVRGSTLQKFILSEITREQLNEPNRDLPPSNKLHVEHILPQDREDGTYEEFGEIEYNDLIDHIGNLALLHRGDNSRCGNKPFSEKKSVYEEYKPEEEPTEIAGQEEEVDKRIPLTAELSDLNEWTPENVRTRGKRLSEVAENVWEPPEVEDEVEG